MRFPIRYKLASIVGITIIPMLVYSFIVFFVTLKNLNESTATRNITIARTTAESVDKIIKNSFCPLYPLAHHPDVVAGKTDKVDRLFATLLPNYPEHLNILLADMNGNNTGSAAQSPGVHQLNYLDKEWFLKGREGKPVITNLHISKLFKFPAIMLALPVFADDGHQTGVLGFPLNLIKMREQLGESWNLPPRSMIMLIDAKRNILVCTLSPEMMGKPLKGGKELETIFTNPEGMIRGKDKGNEDRLISFTTIDRTGWKVMVSVPADESMHAALSEALKHLMLMLLVCLIGIPFAALLSKQFVVKLDKLINGLKEIGRGNLLFKLDARGDDELSMVAYAFNDMTTQRLKAENRVQELNISLEREVLDRTAELRAANRDLEAFSASVAHDLRAPLRHIKGFAAILVEENKECINENAMSYLDRINASCLRMEQLIKDILDLSGIGKKELERELIDLSELCRNIFSELQEETPDRHADIRVTPGLMAYGDRNLITLALQNLLDNAWKYTSHNETAYIEFGMTEMNGEQCYYVKDDGAGFDMARAKKLFTPFQRLHRTDDFAGTGIGLATVERIIDRHGGKIWADAAPGKGATFYFTLP